MTATVLAQRSDIVFRPYLPWLVLRSFGLLGLQAGLVARAIVLHDPRWLLGAAPLAIVAVLLVLRHMADAIILSGARLICRSGVIRVRESSVPIVHLNCEIYQTLPGRLLDYGTVRININGATIAVSNIATIRSLRGEIARRQTEILLTPLGWRGAA